jgi:hypothetical protein
MASVEEHVQALLQLPTGDRARAVQLLLESLDEELKDPEVEQAWAVVDDPHGPH